MQITSVASVGDSVGSGVEALDTGVVGTPDSKPRLPASAAEAVAVPAKRCAWSSPSIRGGWCPARHRCRDLPADPQRCRHRSDSRRRRTPTAAAAFDRMSESLQVGCPGITVNG